jgi:hypothetical protein
VAGAFAQIMGPFINEVPCTCDRRDLCACGFQAHTHMWGAMRYRPLEALIAAVELTGNVRHGGGPRKPYWLGLRQVVTALHVPRLCLVDCAREPTALADWEEVGILRPACVDHGASVSLPELESLTGVSISWMSPQYAEWCRSRRASPTSSRCSCRIVRHVSTDFGLRHYFEHHWKMGARTTGSVFSATCRTCGATWLYDRSLATARQVHRVSDTWADSEHSLRAACSKSSPEPSHPTHHLRRGPLGAPGPDIVVD